MKDAVSGTGGCNPRWGYGCSCERRVVDDLRPLRCSGACLPTLIYFSSRYNVWETDSRYGFDL